MRSRGLLMLIVALLAGLVAVALAGRWLQGQGQGRIAVAGQDIEIGGRIEPAMVRLADWPSGSVPEGAFSDAAGLEGRVVVVGVQRGEPITEARLAPVGTKGGLSAVVPKGKRAMTVRVNDVVGVAGFALPGTFVDVMVNTQEEGSNRSNIESSISKIVLERILVLAVAQEADRDTTKPKVVNAVTLEVTPREAELLDLARSIGNLSLVLRNQGDKGPLKDDGAPNAGATKTELLGMARAQPAAASAVAAPERRTVPRRAATAVVAVLPALPAGPPRPCVEVVRGTAKTTECF